MVTFSCDLNKIASLNSTMEILFSFDSGKSFNSPFTSYAHFMSLPHVFLKTVPVREGPGTKVATQAVRQIRMNKSDMIFQGRLVGIFLTTVGTVAPLC